MVRSTARLLVLVMLLASGRLLACGWECADELAALAEASCHEDALSHRSGLPTVASAKVGETHACLPEIPEPRVTVAKLATDLFLMAAPMVATIVPQGPIAGTPPDHRHALRPRFESPYPPGFSVLRI